MIDQIAIIDRGRGPQLISSRITVQDLVPYFQAGCSHDEILRWLPTLTRDELVIVEAYYRDHQAELDDEDRRLRTHREEQVRAQRLRFPDEDREQRLTRMRRLLAERRRETNGAGNPG
jgi:uncharacterized protein (DUF433 family)